MPASVPDRAGWAVDIYAALAALRIEPSTANVCSVLAVVEQESTYRADPTVPGLGKIARDEIDRRADRAGVPRLLVQAALQLRSPDSRTLQRAHRRGEEREGAERPVRGLHRPGAARPALLRRLQPGAHRRPDAGEHRVRREPRQVALVSVSHDGLGPRRGVHAARRSLLRHRPPARLPGALRPADLPLRRLQRRPVREPQRGVPERGERRLGHRARSRRRPRRSRRRPRQAGQHRGRGALARAPPRPRRERDPARARAGKPRRLRAEPRSTRASSRSPSRPASGRCRAPCCRRSACTARRSRGR